MREHGTRCDTSKSKVGVFKNTEKGCFDSSKKLRCQRSAAEVVVQGDVGEGVGVRPEGDGNNDARADEERRRSWMNGHNVRDAGSGEVVGVSEEHGKNKMTMKATAVCGGNRTNIGKQLMLQ